MLDHIKSLDLMFHQIAPLQLQCIAAGHRAMHTSGKDAGKKKKEKMQKPLDNLYTLLTIVSLKM